jgi:putative transposase
VPRAERLKMIDKTEFLSVDKQSGILDLNRSFFYYSLKGESEENIEIVRLSRLQYYVTPFYGYRKMTVWLQVRGFKVKKRVKRLMKTIK